MFDEVNKILDTCVRPTLAKHYGDIKLVSVENGVVEVKLLGSCNGCPSATSTVENIVEAALKEAIPSIKNVVIKNEISEELWDTARKILNNRNKK
jgi:Fe-S cluster biogenesis protein NfuA